MTTVKKNKKQNLSAEIIKADSGIVKEVKIHLDKCPTHPVRSIPLTEWTRELYKLSQKHGYTDETIRGWIRTYGKLGNWTSRNIRYVLEEVGLNRPNDRYSDSEPEDTSAYQPVELAPTFKKIVVDLSKMDDQDLLDCDYSPDRIAEMAENTLRQWTSRMNEGALRINKKWVKAVSALLKRANELMQQQERSMKLGDMR